MIFVIAVVVVAKATADDVAKEKFNKHSLRRDKYNELVECLNKVYNGDNPNVIIQMDKCSETKEWQERLNCLQNILDLELCFVN